MYIAENAPPCSPEYRAKKIVNVNLAWFLVKKFSANLFKGTDRVLFFFFLALED